MDSERRLSGLEILVAEDSDDMWRLAEYFLKRAGAIANRAVNGLEAVEKACAHEYSAILMDVQMPVMDGLEATRTLREKGLELPIIAFTTNSQIPHEADSKEAGCSAHLTKPQSGAAMVDKIADCCALS